MASEPQASVTSSLDAPRPTLVPAAVRAWATAHDTRTALLRIGGYFVLTRLTLFIIAACAIRIIPAGIQPPTEVYLGKNLSLATWVRWDSWWYLSVVERGYWFDPQTKSNVAFFPVFPLVIKGLTALIGNQVVAGLLVANGAALAATLVFWLWVRGELGPVAADRSALWLLVYPFSFFFHSLYAEPLFFLLVSLAFLAVSRRHWPLAGVLGALAAATRPMGILLFPAYAWELVRERRAGRPIRPSHVLAVLMVPAGLGAYVLYLGLAFGEPLAFWQAHVSGWNVRFHWDLAGYWREASWILRRGPRIQAYTQLLDSLRIVLPVTFVVLTVVVFRRLGGGPGLYTAGSVGVSILFAPESVGREFLAAVPAFAAAGLLDRGGSLAEGTRMLSFGLAVVFLFAFATAHFVG
jgi:hypothetical protein